MYLSFYNRFTKKNDYESQAADLNDNFYYVLAALKEDLQNIFNTECRIQNAASYGLSDSILNYGFIGFKNYNLLSNEDQEAFCRAVEQCIQWHEPRLADISVKLDENFLMSDLTINFKIYAILTVDNIDYPLLLQSTLNPIGGIVLIKDIKSLDYG